MHREPIDSRSPRLEKLHQILGGSGDVPYHCNLNQTRPLLLPFGRLLGRRTYSTTSRTCRVTGVLMVTSSSAELGCRAMVASKLALVAFILTAIATI